MSIPRRASLDRAAHDALLGGINGLDPPAWSGRNGWDDAFDRWWELRFKYHRLLRDTPASLSRLPDRLSARDLSRLVATLLSPDHRPLLRELLLDLLADDIADIALAVAQEVRR